jgi:hypothetical protein
MKEAYGAVGRRGGHLAVKVLIMPFFLLACETQGQRPGLRATVRDAVPPDGGITPPKKLVVPASSFDGRRFTVALRSP